jgi:FkbM family methyltransferase
MLARCSVTGGIMPQGRSDLDFNIVSYAINAEDVVLVRAFAGRRKGFFVDVGAGDPEEESVTKNLVDRLDWRGINIEPLPEMFDRLQGVRHGDINIKAAVDLIPGEATFYRIVAGPGLEGGPGLSTLDPEIAKLHRKSGWGVQELEVEVVTLESILSEYASPGFDLLKVDVEGREAAVLASADLAYWRPRVLLVEATLPDSPEPSYEQWEPLVLESGYTLALFDGLNRFYSRADELELLRRLSAPANVFDRWIPVAWARRLGLDLEDLNAQCASRSRPR